MDPEVARGKAAILEHVKEVMQAYSIESTGLVFQWKEDFEKARWNLNVFSGSRKRQLRFQEQDVEAWQETPEVAGKYLATILSVVECLLKNG
jgi:hypothetical protein